jgi:NAD(P)-dependent dehydrogenase (short-subunit alcohol dehydrogenase family)
MMSRSRAGTIEREKSMKKRLDQRIAVVTGAGSGIGRAVAELFSREGARVHAAEIDAGSGRELAAGSDGGIVAHEVDVADPDAVERLARDVLAAEERVDILVSNAGVCAGGRADKLPLEDWRRTVEVNLMGAVHCLRSFGPSMTAAGSGRIVMVASAAGLIGFPFVAPYVASKFALVGLAESLDIELASRGVRVAAVCPGPAGTKLFERAELRTSPELASRLARLMERGGTPPERVARDVLAAALGRRQSVTRGGLLTPLLALKRLSPELYTAAFRMAARRLQAPGSR